MWFLAMWCHMKRHLPQCCFGNTIVVFCFICCAISPPSWGLKYALILLMTARGVYCGQQQEACRNLWGVCISAENEPSSLLAVSFHYSRGNFLQERGSCSRQTLHKRERDARTGSKSVVMGQGQKQKSRIWKARGEMSCKVVLRSFKC